MITSLCDKTRELIESPCLRLSFKKSQLIIYFDCDQKEDVVVVWSSSISAKKMLLATALTTEVTDK